MDKIYRYEFIVFGVVQGVGMRYFVKNLADTHGLVGWVNNQPDGSLKIIAEGTKEILDIFCEKFKKGNGIAKIENISINKILINKYSFAYFEIEP
ncbi:MAG: acylphosphatase [Endomicrobiales bacterium]|nr:acylphosphatase [Endomicrobiales bacterium]